MKKSQENHSRKRHGRGTSGALVFKRLKKSRGKKSFRFKVDRPQDIGRSKLPASEE